MRFLILLLSATGSLLAQPAIWEDWSCATGTAAWDGTHTVITCAESSPFQSGQYITISGATGSWAPLNTQQWFGLRWDINTTQTVWNVNHANGLELGNYSAPFYQSTTEVVALTAVDTVNNQVTVTRGVSGTPQVLYHSVGSSDFWIGPTSRQATWCVNVIDATHIWLASPSDCTTPLDSSSFGSFSGQNIRIRRASGGTQRIEVLYDYLNDFGAIHGSIGVSGAASTKTLDLSIPGCTDTSNLNLCSQSVGSPPSPLNEAVGYPDLDGEGGVSSMVTSGGVSTVNLSGFAYTYNPPLTMVAPNQIIWLYAMTEPSFQAINAPWVIQSVTPAPAVLTQIVVTGNSGSGGTATATCSGSCGVSINTNVTICCQVQASFLAGTHFITATPTGSTFQFSSDSSVPNGTYTGLAGMFYVSNPPTSFTINTPGLPDGTYHASGTVGCAAGNSGNIHTCQMILPGPNSWYSYWGGGSYASGGYMLGSKQSRQATNAAANRFRVWVQYGKTFPVPQTGKYSFQWGNYSNDGIQQTHFYHQPNTGGAAGQWVLMEFNATPMHIVSGLVPGYYPNDPSYNGWMGTPAWGGGVRHYLDSMATWYLQFGLAGWNSAGQTAHFGRIETEYVTAEPEEFLRSTRTVFYDPVCGCYQLGWNRPDELGTTTAVSYEVRYSTSGSIKTGGFSSATLSGTVTDNGSTLPYTDLNYATGAIAQASSIWFAIRPTMPIYNVVQGSGSTEWITIDRDPNMIVGDHITVAGVTCSAGSCAALNQTAAAITAVQPRQLWNLKLPSSGYTTAGQLTSIVCSSGTCTVNMNSVNHNLVPGMAVQIYGTATGGPSAGQTFTRYIVQTTPTAQSFTITCGGCSNGTYNTDYGGGAHLQMYSLPAVALSASGGGTVNAGTGTLVSSENSKNFAEIAFTPPAGSAPAATTASVTGGGISGH